MSSFLVFILTAPSTITGNPKSCVAALLAPYSENIEVAPYQTDCYCIGRIARLNAFNAAGGQAKLNALRDEYFRLPENNHLEWKDFITEFLEKEDATLNAHPLYNKPDFTCEECNGTGRRETTYNPESKWDKFQIGGRWTGLLQELAPSPRWKNYNGYIQEVANILADWKDNFTPYAIVTPDGRWHERQKVDWWDRFSFERNAWVNEAKTILTAHAFCLAIVVDCHI